MVSVKELAVIIIVMALAVPATVIAFCLVWGAVAWLAERVGIGDWGERPECPQVEEEWW